MKNFFSTFMGKLIKKNNPLPKAGIFVRAQISHKDEVSCMVYIKNQKKASRFTNVEKIEKAVEELLKTAVETKEFLIFIVDNKKNRPLILEVEFNKKLKDSGLLLSCLKFTKKSYKEL